MKPNTVGREIGRQMPPLRTENAHTGLVAGTLLLTADGEIPVEYLSVGDRIITRNAGYVPLRALHSIRVTEEAVKIAAGSLGDTKPTHHVMVPASQMVLVRDWRARALGGAAQAVLPAGCLIDDEFITSLGPREMTLVCLGFEAPHVVYADGLELSVPAMSMTGAAAA
ncbi:Hint domain-containing protein [uncultured Tateyamaria sp.]|uniref:Hint domain-containing protein n=1 Tax=uncultured Tateyamaria sp. TaxID=455651 RepID=UPI00261BEAB3|nr:Hint domain-containing protein [uncultured Tateyamaria sp.]